MKDRTPLMMGLIVVLAIVVVYANWDFFQPAYKHPRAVTNLLSWQGETPSQRKLELRRGLDLQGGLQVLLEVDREQMEVVKPEDLESAANTIKNRVDTLGVTEPQVQTQGEDKISVELPGVSDPELAVKTVQKTALLEFVYGGAADAANPLSPGDKIVTTLPTLYRDLPPEKQKPFEGNPRDPLGTGAAVTGTAGARASGTVTGTTGLTSPVGATNTATLSSTSGVSSTSAVTPTGPTTTTIYPTVVTGNYLRDASVGFTTNGLVAVQFAMNSDGGSILQRFTKDHIEEVMAIALDKEIISAPVLRDAIADQGEITGNFTQPEAEALVAQLKSGALPFSLRVVGQTKIGPTLGAETVHAAVKGGLIGLLVVILFMVIYYRMPGVIAAIALLLYALITLTVFRVLPVTLTLAGIAGFVLSIGMAVDANILIFERLKEELRQGRRLGQAMEAGFSRAWPSIRDSNVSTMITCAILFWFGNQFGASIVKGFALTLFLGVITSMFTAIVVTRTLLIVANRVFLRDETGTSIMENPRLRRLFGF